jgi:nucleoid-associated protein YgaU
MSAKASIWKVPRSGDAQKVLDVYFNPKELSFAKQNNWKQNNSPKENIPSGEFSGGGSASLKVQLFFDTYTEKEQEDVRVKYTSKIAQLMEIDESTVEKNTGKGRPPDVRFIWGPKSLTFDGVITNFSERLTLFLTGDGRPVRAVVDLTLTQVRDPKSHKKTNPTSGGVGGERVWIVRHGDTLPWIAYQEYDDATEWRRIADANGLSEVRDLRPGMALVIPNA